MARYKVYEVLSGLALAKIDDIEGSIVDVQRKYEACASIGSWERFTCQFSGEPYWHGHTHDRKLLIKVNTVTDVRA